MSTERRVQRLNNLLRQELGDSPLYNWRHAPTLTTEVCEVDEYGAPVYDYLCGCGVNRIVHDPACRTLTVPDPRPFTVNLAPRHPDAWILCSLQYPGPEHIWRQTYGQRMHYPREGIWIPLGANGNTVAMPNAQPPDLESTLLVICMIREHRATDLRQQLNDDEWAHREHIRKRKVESEYLFREMMSGVSAIPGKKEDVSFPGVHLRQTRQVKGNIPVCN